MFFKIISISTLITLSSFSFGQQLDSVLRRSYQDSIWASPNYKYIYVYDDGLLKELRGESKGSSSVWEPAFYDLFEYNSNGLKVKEIRLSKSFFNQQFDTSWVWNYRYDSQNRLILKSGRNQPIDSFAFDQSGNVKTRYGYSSGAWDKRVIKYYSQNRLDSSISVFLDTISGNYKANFKTFYSYYPNDSIKAQDKWTFDFAGDSLRQLRTDSFLFDQNGIRMASKDYRYFPSKYLRTLNEYSYSNNGLIVTENSSRAFGPSDTLKPSYGRIFYYSETSLNLNETTQNKILIYPNPARDKAYINCQNCGDRIHLFDLNGSLIKSYHWDEHSKTIDTEGLPDGNYLIRSKEVSGRLIIIH